MDGGGPDALALELLDQTVGAPLGPDEDEGLGRPPTDGGGHLDLVHLVNLEKAVLHEIDGDPGRGHFVADRVGQVTADEPVDVTVESGREEHGLVGLLDPPQHPVDLGEKSHVGHPVGLVEDGHFDVGHRYLAAVGEVDESSRGGDDDVHALVQLLDLPLDVGPAVEDDGPATEGLGQRLEDLGYLNGQFPGGDEDEAPGAPGGRGAQAHEEGQAESQGLARARLGLAADVAAGDGVGDGDGLDRERGFDPLGGEDGHQFGGHPQFLEGGGQNRFRFGGVFVLGGTFDRGGHRSHSLFVCGRPSTAWGCGSASGGSEAPASMSGNEENW